MYYKMGTNMDSGCNFVGYLHTVGKHSQDKLNFKQSNEGKLNCRCADHAYSLHCGPLQTNFSLCRPWQRCEREKGYNLSLLGFFIHPWGSHFLRHCNIGQILIGDVVVHGWLTLGQLLPQHNATSNTCKSSFLVDFCVTRSFVEPEDKNSQL